MINAKFRSMVHAVAVEEIVAERRRQISKEGWTPEHDDAHAKGELAFAAACYAEPAPLLEVRQFEGYDGAYRGFQVPVSWPPSWSPVWWKPKDRRRNLARAGALILAELERLDRAAARLAS